MANIYISNRGNSLEGGASVETEEGWLVTTHFAGASVEKLPAAMESP